MTGEVEREQLRGYLVQELGVREDLLEGDTPLLDAGLIDSLGVVEVVAFCEERLGCVVPPEEISPEAFQSLDTLVEAVVQRWRPE